MKLLTFRAEHLFSIGKAEIDLESQGVVLVTGYSHDEGGANGSGKSSLSNKGLLWTLFGQTAYGTKGDSVINRHTKSKAITTMGEVVFEGVDGRTYTITRTRNPNKLKFECGTADLTMRNESETQTLINRSLGRDFKTFVQTEFFGQGRKDSYPELTPAQQKDILEQILPMDKLSAWSDKAKEAQSALKALQQSITIDVVAAEREVIATQNQVASVQQRLLSFDKDKEEKIANAEKLLAERERQLAEYNDKMADLVSKRDTVNKKIQDLDIDVVQARLAELEKENKSLEESLTEFRNSHSEWSTYTMLAKGRCHEVKDQYCYVCNNPINQDVVERLKAERAAAEAEAIQGQVILSGIEFNVSELVKRINEVAEKIVACKESLSSYRNLQESASILTSLIHDLELSVAKGRSIEDLKVEIEAAKKEINPLKYVFQQIVDALDSAKGRHADAKAKLKRVEKELEAVGFWREAFDKTLRTHIFHSVCPFLADRTEHYLRELCNSQIHVQFSTVKTMKSGESKEDFNVLVWSDTGGQDYELLSGGEQQIVSFAIGLALSDLARSQTTGDCDFMILDEPFVNMDARNAEAVVNFLTHKAGKDTILLVSNEDALKNLVPRRIHMVKRNGVSSREDE